MIRSAIVAPLFIALVLAPAAGAGVPAPTTTQWELRGGVYASYEYGVAMIPPMLPTLTLMPGARVVHRFSLGVKHGALKHVSMQWTTVEGPSFVDERGWMSGSQPYEQAPQTMFAARIAIPNTSWTFSYTGMSALLGLLGGLGQMPRRPAGVRTITFSRRF